MKSRGATLRAVFWDNDGVLVGTELLYFRATAEVLARVGVDLDEGTFRRLFLVEGRGAWHLAVGRGLPKERVEALRAERNALYARRLERESLVFPGVPEVLEALHGRVAMAVVTSALRGHFETIHARTGLLRFFDFVLTREDYGRSKPDPEPYLLAVKRAGEQPSACLVVEDSERGLRAAKAAGLECWVVPNELTRPGDFAAADRVLASVAEVPRHLLRRVP